MVYVNETRSEVTRHGLRCKSQLPSRMKGSCLPVFSFFPWPLPKFTPDRKMAGVYNRLRKLSFITDGMTFFEKKTEKLTKHCKSQLG